MKPQRSVSFLTVFLFIIPLLFSCDDPAPNEPPEEKVKQWYFLGLANEDISAIAIDPQNSDVIYAGSTSDFSGGTVGGIFKTIDGGAVWDTLVRGVTVLDIDLHPYDSQIVYVTCGYNFLTPPGLIRSRDAGLSWERADTGLGLRIEEQPYILKINPLHPDTMFLGTAGESGGGVFSSRDGAGTWSRLPTPFGNGVTAIELPPLTPNVVYVGTPGIGTIYKSLNNGETWERLEFPEVGIVYVLKYITRESPMLCAGTWKNGFYYSSNQGESWIQANDGFPSTLSVRSICSDGDSIYIGAGAYGSYSSDLNTLTWYPIRNSLFTTANVLRLDQYDALYLGSKGIHVRR